MKLPSKIIATKQVVYETDFALFLAKENGIDTTNWTIEDVVNMLDDEITSDFGQEANPVIEFVD